MIFTTKVTDCLVPGVITGIKLLADCAKVADPKSNTIRLIAEIVFVAFMAFVF